MLVQQIAMTRWWGVQFLLKKEAHELHQHFSSLCLLFHLKSRRWGGAAGGRGFRVHSSVQCGLLGASCKIWLRIGDLMEWQLNPRQDAHPGLSQIVQDAIARGAGSCPQFSVTRKNGWLRNLRNSKQEWMWLSHHQDFYTFPIVTSVATRSQLQEIKN